MIGDNLRVTVALNSALNIATVQNALRCLTIHNKVKPDSFRFESNIAELFEFNDSNASYAWYNRFIFDFIGNDYGIDAFFSLTLYGHAREGDCDIISISPFNHPAGEFLQEENGRMAELFKSSFERIGVFEFLLFTNDAWHDPVSLIEILRQNETERVPEEVIYRL